MKTLANLELTDEKFYFFTKFYELRIQKRVLLVSFQSYADVMRKKLKSLSRTTKHHSIFVLKKLHLSLISKILGLITLPPSTGDSMKCHGFVAELRERILHKINNIVGTSV